MSEWLTVWVAQDIPASFEERERGWVRRRVEQGCILFEGTWYRFCSSLLYDLESVTVRLNTSGTPTHITLDDGRAFRLERVM